MTVTMATEKPVRPVYRPFVQYMVYLTTQCALRCEYCFLFKSEDWMSHETAVKVGNYVVIAHGTADEAAKAKSILNTSKPSSVSDHVLEPAGAAVAG